MDAAGEFIGRGLQIVEVAAVVHFGAKADVTKLTASLCGGDSPQRAYISENSSLTRFLEAERTALLRQKKSPNLCLRCSTI